MATQQTKPQRLTESYIKAITWDGRDRREALGDGLYLLIRKASKTWLYRRRSGNVETFETLGHHPAMNVKAAKAEAADRARRADLSTATVGDVLTQYRVFLGTKQRRPEQAIGYLDRVFTGAWLTRRVREVRRSELVGLIQGYRLYVVNKPKGRKGDGTRAADSLRAVLYGFFGYALQLGAVDDNPLEGVTPDVSGYVSNPRTRVLNDEELRAVWALDNVHGTILRFLLLTGLRISEVRLGHREGERWVVPAAVSKTGKKVPRDHWVHLTPTAVSLLPLPGRSAEATQHWLRTWCEKHGVAPFVPHDCRRTAVTRLNGLIEPWLAERWVGHNLQGMMAVYNHHDYADERKRASEALEAHLLTVVGAPKANVIPHPAARERTR